MLGYSFHLLYGHVVFLYATHPFYFSNRSPCEWNECSRIRGGRCCLRAGNVSVSFRFLPPVASCYRENFFLNGPLCIVIILLFYKICLFCSPPVLNLNLDFRTSRIPALLTLVLPVWRHSHFGRALPPLSWLPLAYIYLKIIQKFYFLSMEPNDIQTVHNVGNHHAYRTTENIKVANPHEVPYDTVRL